MPIKPVLENAILITGASQRVGLYLAEAFLKQGQYPVVFTYRTFRPSVQALIDQGAIGFQVDFTDSQSLEAFIADLPKHLSSLRALIHNASIWMKEGAVEENPSLFQKMIDVHMTAPYFLNKACYPLLKNSRAESKDIIAITDAQVLKGHCNQIAYLATKSGLQSMTQSFAKAYAPEVKVNEILPGLVLFNDTDSEVYKAERLEKMSVPMEPGADIVWQTVQYLMALPNTTGTQLSLSDGE